MALTLLIGLTTPIHSQEGGLEPLEVPVENLESLIRTLETPEKREALLDGLKALVESQKMLVEKEPPLPEKPNLVERVRQKYSQVAQETSGFLQGILSLIRSVPQGIGKTGAYLSAPENRAVLYRTVVIVGVGIASALIIVFLIQRITRALSMRLLRRRKWKGRARIYGAILRVIIRVSPYVVNLLGIRGVLYEFGIVVLSALFIYEAVYNCSRILLSPFERGARVFRLTNENAAYIWIWIKRFLNLWVFYYVVTQSLMILSAPPILYGVVSRVLILFFPILSTVLLLQIRRMYVEPRERRRGATFLARMGSYLVRFWPLVAGAVIWLVSVFIMADYHEGIVFLVFAAVKTLVALGILWGVLFAIEFLFSRLFRVGQEIKQRFPGLVAKTDRYIGTVKLVMKGVVAAVAAAIILEFWGLRTSWFITSETGSMILSRIIAIAITVVLVIVVIDFSGFLTNQLIQTRTDENGGAIAPGRKRRTILPLFHWLVNVAAVFIGGVFVLSQVGLNITPILAGAGIVGLAVGFGAQSLVKDFISGLFMLFEDSVAVGDVVVINGTGGLVEAVTLRTVKMRDLAGNVHVIPNGTVDMITNMTKEYSRYVFEVGVAYREDVDEVMEVLLGIGKSMEEDPVFKDDIIGPLEVLGVDKFDDSAVVIKARITTKPIQQWRIGREFNRRMKKVFDEKNIEIPFPHRTIYWGEPKTGQAPPVAVQLSGELASESNMRMLGSE
jgi:small conductance mechanosensitive channel